MTIGPREVMRSEAEGLTGPAHPISEQSIDCGCSQVRCPKLERFATRCVFVSLLCWLGLLQAAAHSYLYVTSSTIARRFQIDPYWMDWILTVSEITPFFLGLIIAYWGDRIHRISWLGGVTFIQCLGFTLIIMPEWDTHFRVIEQATNNTHMSLYADASQELCSSASSRIIFEDEQIQNGVIPIQIFVQILNGVANIGYYAFGISYLDDNTKKIHISSFLGIIVAIKIIGTLFGYILAWSCLRIDSKNLEIVQTYTEQIGAWWLGWPILTVLILIGAIFLSWFPRRLPSEMVQQAAATILDEASGTARTSQMTFKKVGSTRFLPSILRLVTNKILISNVFAAAFCAMAIVNFIANENIFLESRFYAPRPTGLLLGFNDPLTSRIATTFLKPVVIGLVVIVSGLLIARVKPTARTLAIYSIVITIVTGIILFSLTFVACDKKPIVGENINGMFSLSRHCNYDCQCSRDANFRPVCDSSGKYTYYSPCHAGCTQSDYIDDEKIYTGCKCLLSAGLTDARARDGSCEYKNCQFGWLIFEAVTIVAYSLLASIIVGDLLINLRSVYVQDKALSIGFWMTLVAAFIHVPGKLIYQKIADTTCVYWGSAESNICRLHNSKNLGDYLCYATILFLAISAIIRIMVWWFCENLNLYDTPIVEEEPGRELEEINRMQREPLLIEEIPAAEVEEAGPSDVQERRSLPPGAVQVLPKKIEDDHQKNNGPLKYGPLGPGDRRTQDRNVITEVKSEDYDTDNELDTSSDDGSLPLKKASPKVAYKPLDFDSDHDATETIPKTIPQSKLSPIESGARRFPNPDHYEDPRRSRATSPFEKPWRKTGDFNEIGIPIVEPIVQQAKDLRSSKEVLEERMLSPQYEKKASQDRLDTVRTLFKTMEDGRFKSQSDVNDQPLSIRPPSGGQESSGFGSLPDVRERITPQLQELNSTSRDNLTSKNFKTSSFACTDL
ncbi:solute carrier organic anion transporter family member 2A1-like isoform X2 [Leptopilina boulardi]|uniref:solute carrier organic anion transporter family member 2A1-like isoform X2 n=1 Tax=Leptopilina boulardi TaxID=63433 RepID=UPI0021F50550|nr:solute carrier organic anion transporter family member 2A1-like isoform X2 [Leptopilina boulardi]